MVRRKKPAPVVDLQGVRERVRGAQDVVRGAVEGAGGSVEEIRPGRIVIVLPGGRQRVELSIREIDYIPQVFEFFRQQGGPIPPDLRKTFIERGLLDPEETPS